MNKDVSKKMCRIHKDVPGSKVKKGIWFVKISAICKGLTYYRVISTKIHKMITYE